MTKKNLIILCIASALITALFTVISLKPSPEAEIKAADTIASNVTSEAEHANVGQSNSPEASLNESDYRLQTGELSLKCFGQNDLTSLVEKPSDTEYAVVYTPRFHAISMIRKISNEKEDTVFWIEDLISSNLNEYKFLIFDMEAVKLAYLVGKKHDDQELMDQQGYWVMKVNRKNLSIELEHKPGNGYSIGTLYRSMTCEINDEKYFIDKVKDYIRVRAESAAENKI